MQRVGRHNFFLIVWIHFVVTTKSSIELIALLGALPCRASLLLGFVFIAGPVETSNNIIVAMNQNLWLSRLATFQ